MGWNRGNKALRLSTGMIVRRGHYLYFAKNWLQTLLLDIKVAGRRLEDVTLNENPANYPVQSISYPYLRLLPQSLTLRADDVFVDVGCGMGRLIGYLSRTSSAKRFVGIELNPHAAQVAKKVGERDGEIEIIEGDAVSKLPVEATALLLFNPFGEDILACFLDTVETRCAIGTRLYYLYPEHRDVIDGRSSMWALQAEYMLQPKHMGGITLLEYKLIKRGSA